MKDLYVTNTQQKLTKLQRKKIKIYFTSQKTIYVVIKDCNQLNIKKGNFFVHSNYARSRHYLYKECFGHNLLCGKDSFDKKELNLLVRLNILRIY